MRDEYLGKRSTTIVETIQLSDDNWGVEETVIHARSKDLATWEEKKVSIKVMDKDMDRAMAQAILSLTQYLETIDYDLFNVPPEEGIEIVQ